MNWYEKAFGNRYLEVYSHRNRQEAERALELIEYVADFDSSGGQLVLDLACGQGRYSRLLADKGHRVAAVDLSMPLLERGKASSPVEYPRGGAVWYVRADMRAVPFQGSFGLAISMFTRFGYFQTDQENATVLRQIHDALAPGGRWLIDYLNRPRVIDTLVAQDSSIRGGLQITQRRRLEDEQRRVVKDVLIEGPEGRQQWTESVRMYGRGELESMLAGADLAVENVYGDYRREQYAEDSPRLILAGRKI
jgi:SAM-dependent methyltransferase